MENDQSHGFSCHDVICFNCDCSPNGLDELGEEGVFVRRVKGSGIKRLQIAILFPRHHQSTKLVEEGTRRLSLSLKTIICTIKDERY